MLPRLSVTCRTALRPTADLIEIADAPRWRHPSWKATAFGSAPKNCPRERA